MSFSVKIAPPAVRELKDIRIFDRRRIVQAIDQQLTNEATVATRNRKLLSPDLQPSFPCEPPVWELRVGDFRVFYDVDEDVVFVRAIRIKAPHQTTEQSL